MKNKNETINITNNDEITNNIVTRGSIITRNSLNDKNLSVGWFIYKFIKRSFDIIFSVFGITIIIPIALVIKFSYILAGDFDSIVYSQNRIGKNGIVFKLFKFRTMVTNSDEILKEILKNTKYKEEWDKNQKLSNDPRVTKIGKILRKTSLDEVPQFINVLIGDMSLIGPRPLVLGELDSHNGNHEIYESIEPGITSWWASNGRSNTTYEERLQLEYYYIENQSILLDIKCMLLTIKAVVCKKGAK